MKKKISGGLLVLFLLFSLVACAPESIAPGSSSPSAIPNPPRGPGPEMGIMADRVPDIIAAYGENVEVNLSFTNQASKSNKISPFPPEIRIIELPDEVPPATVIRAFPVGNGELVLQPGESVSHNIEWDQKNESGEQVEPGWYSVEVTLSTSRGSPVRVLVLPPEGVMEKTIEINQSVIVNGISITLERVELTATGMKVYAFNTPPDYNLPQGPMLAPPQFMALHASAEYSIDDGAARQAFSSGIRFLENGMQHSWDQYLDPVPQNSHNLTFRITKIGDYEGPWEFKIPLESGLPFEAGIGIANNQESFLPGDEVMYGIGIRNLSPGIITIDPYGPAMQIRSVDRNKTMYSSPAGNRTQDIVTEYPMSWYRTKGVWDQKDNNGQQVPPGWYEIGYEYVIIEQSTGKSFKTDLKTRFQIVPPDSAMNKDLEINQSVTAEGIKVTLESLELNAVKGTVSVFTVPPGYTPPQERPMEESVSKMFESLLTKSVAEYSVDGSITKHPVDIRMKSNESGVWLIWDIGPIPVDAQGFIFTVRQLGDWAALWEFKVKLN